MSISLISENSWNSILKIQEEAYIDILPEDINVLKSKWISSPNTCAIYLNNDNKILAYLLLLIHCSLMQLILHSQDINISFSLYILLSLLVQCCFHGIIVGTCYKWCTYYLKR